MASRSLNKVQLIGNLTRDPELRYTPQGTAVCTFGLATNRTWVTEAGEKKEETEFHRVVAWNKLAEICSQYLQKGRRTYVEGRLQTRQWTAQDGSSRQTTEVVINEMIILDSRKTDELGAAEMTEVLPEEFPADKEKPVTKEFPKTEAAKGETTSQKSTDTKAKKGKKMPTEKNEETTSTTVQAEENEAEEIMKDEPDDNELGKNDIPF